jgi:hypothetical protein
MDIKTVYVRGELIKGFDDFINSLEPNDLMNFKFITEYSKDSFSFSVRRSEDTPDNDLKVGLDIALLDGVEG